MSRKKNNKNRERRKDLTSLRCSRVGQWSIYNCLIGLDCNHEHEVFALHSSIGDHCDIATGCYLDSVSMEKLVKIDEFCEVSAFVTLKTGTSIGKNSQLFSFCEIGAFAEIGENCLIQNKVQIDSFVKIGKRCVIESEAKIGNSCLIGDDVNIAVNCSLGQNVTLGKGVKLRPNVTIEDGVFIPSGYMIPFNEFINKENLEEKLKKFVHLRKIYR